ncbi:gliding motility-associated C-terminal domain-containing protein [Flagellimonas amoyensis]|uniref:Ig-like domain-containing protein n=1 Tax=Flagellimonas amoyensis TaxID=2169401 RepID=UPI001F35F154|nr:gliding motility-associated C-terminal domain-containing protein [Allomuricauda amoyensis]
MLSIYSINGQTFATTIISEDEVDNAANAIDGNLSTSATVRANSGVALGLGAYAGHLEMEFPSTLPTNTTSYVKLETEDDLLPLLLGGSLGGLLSDIVGVLLIGNQEFTVAVKNNAATVMEESSGDVSPFSSDMLRVVTNVDNDYFLAMAPNSDYNRVRLTNRIGSLIGLNNTRELSVFGAYHGPDLALCGTPTYTSFDGSGLTLDLLNLGAGVTDPHLAIDGDLGTSSELGLGILGVAASIEQTVYFDTLSEAGENFYIRLGVDPELVQVGLLNNIQAIVQNGAQSPLFSGSISSLLALDLLGLLEGGQAVTIPLDPGGPADRVTIRLTSLLNISLDQNLNLFEIYRAPAMPELDPDSQDVSICDGSSVDLTATTSVGNQLRWYDAETGGNLLATLNSGEAYTTPVLNTDTTYYVAAVEVGCPEESPRVPVTVSVVDIPTASDITIIGDENPICSSNDVALIPSSDVDGTYSWYFDANATNQITDGQVVGSVTYNIDPDDGTLTITGLNQAGSPYSYYVRVTEATAGCENAPGDLQVANVEIVDSGASVSIISAPIITLDNLIDFFLGTPTYAVSGNVTGDANVGDDITLTINGQTYVGVLDANLDFEIDVDGSDLALDPDAAVEVFINGGLCTLTGDIDIDIPVLIVDDLLQIFCASDNPTLLDLEVGANISLFDSLDTLVELDLDTPLVDGEVYFAGILGVPISVLTRVGITVNIINPPTPTTTSSTQTFCASDDPTVGDLQVNEPNVVFYDSPSGGQELAPSTALINGTNYYGAIRDSDGCESTNRLQIAVVVEGETPTTLSSTQAFCADAAPTIADIQVNEANIVFYDSPSGGQELDASSPLVNASNYYAAIRETSGCESTIRLQIAVTVDDGGPITLTGQTEEACRNGEEYTYTTDTDKQQYAWTVTGGSIVAGGTATDDFVTVTWDSLQGTSITVGYDDPANCNPVDTFQLDVAVVECVLGEEFCLRVYNEFSPNNDGFNDFFEIECIQDYANSIQVFNRNGNKVFEASDYQNNWDGIANVNGVLNKGEHLPSGTYYYVINIPELNRNLVGWLQLAR